MNGKRASSILAVYLLFSCGVFSVLNAADDGILLDEAAVGEKPITLKDREHWAYQPLRRPQPPMVSYASWVRNPIDRFILSRLEKEGLVPLPEAERVTLIRRLTLDLTGLPPMPDEVEDFVSDSSPNAYRKLLERLLASSAYGERWGQHWLDLARFAETDGFEQDKLRPNAWRYRDWVIEALNSDLPFDEFVRLQVAGDELRPADPGAAVATGFTLCGPDMSDINLLEERSHMVLNDMTATVGAVFLGLQMGCAQCHDHKFDPISQADFYRLRAFFEHTELFKDHPLPEAAAHRPGEGRVLRELRSRIKPSFLMVRGSFRRPGPRVEPAFPRIANRGAERVTPPPRDARTSGRRSALARWLTRPDHPLVTRVIVNRIWQHHFGEGLVRTPSDFGSMGGAPSHPELLDWLATELPRLGWSLKRLHTLILSSATYRQASHPSLAVRVADKRDGRTAAGPRDAPSRSSLWRRVLEEDPQNRLLARQNRKRLEAEVIRDAVLAVADRLSRRRGGKGVMPPLPEEIRKSIRRDHWKVTPDAADHRRRSVYLFVRRNLRYPLLQVFDRPDMNASCARRNRTTIAPQALALLNSALSLEAARHLAGLVLAHTGADRESQVARVYRRALGRPPSAVELEVGLDFLEAQASRLRSEGRRAADLALPEPSPEGVDPHAAGALTGFCLAVLNLNEFVYVD